MRVWHPSCSMGVGPTSNCLEEEANVRGPMCVEEAWRACGVGWRRGVERVRRECGVARTSEPMSVAHMTRSVQVGGSVGTTEARTSRWCT